MSVYPISVHTVSMDHKGGTKSYHLVRLVTNDGKSVVVNRWGKKGVFGDIKVHHFRSGEERVGVNAFDKKYREKTSNGYETVRDDEVYPKDETELRRALGRTLFIALGATTVSFIDPDIDVSGLRDAKRADYDEDGYKVDNALRVDPREIERQLEAQKRAEAEAAAAEMKVLPTFGLF